MVDAEDFSRRRRGLSPLRRAPATGGPPLGVLLGLAGSASLGLTMMACYGCPPGDCRAVPPDGNSDTTGADGGALD